MLSSFVFYLASITDYNYITVRTFYFYLLIYYNFYLCDGNHQINLYHSEQVYKKYKMDKWSLVEDDCVYLAKLGKSLIDEDEGDEDGEDLLSEAGNEAHQEASLHGNNRHDDDHQPRPNPHSAYDVLDALRLTELQPGGEAWENINEQDRHLTSVFMWML